MAKALFIYESPLGPLHCYFLGEDLVEVALGLPEDSPDCIPGGCRRLSRTARQAKRLAAWFDAYFAGRQVAFTGRIAFVEGTAFEKKVWHALKNIPWGQVRTYKWLAGQVGSPRAARAVGQAVGRNPLPIILPCHRIVRSDGGLGGFSCGIEVKRRLLGVEGSPHGDH